MCGFFILWASSKPKWEETLVVQDNGKNKQTIWTLFFFSTELFNDSEDESGF